MGQRGAAFVQTVRLVQVLTRYPIHLLVMFLGNSIVLCPKILGVRANLRK